MSAVGDMSGMPQASRWETLGAWLRLWTPPRDTYVPPRPPGRRLALIALAVGVPLAAAVIVGFAAIDRGKEQGAARDRHAEAAIVARETARLRVDQAPHHARGAALPLGAPPARLRAARTQLIVYLQNRITADALARYRAHRLDRHVVSTDCYPFVRPAVVNPPQPPLTAREGRYECIAVTGSLGPPTSRASAVTGYPFWARVDFRNSKLVWCKTNRRPGEHGVNGELAFVPLAPECDLLGH